MPENGSGQKQKAGKVRVWPGTRFGWWALGTAAAGIGSWVILPIITTIFRNRYPVTDTWVMPVIGTVIIDIAAVINLICIWPRHERGVLNVIAAVIVISSAALFTFIFLGETLSGV